MDIFGFLQWVLESFWRTVGLVFIISVIGTCIANCFPLFTINKKEEKEKQ